MYIATLTCLYASFRGSFLIVPPVRSSDHYSLAPLLLTVFQYSPFHSGEEALGKDARVLALIALTEKWGSSSPPPTETDREFCTTDAL